ncbi:MAG: tyrosine-type recombinase/integrase [Candidatus Hodarchaeota archaeon]
MRKNRQLFDVYFDELEQQCHAGLVKRSTLRQRRRAVKYLLEFMDQSNIDLKNLNSAHIRAFLQYLSLRQTYTGKKFAAATIKQAYALSRSFYVSCYGEKRVTTPPDQVFKRDLLRQYVLGEQKLPKYIDKEDMKALLEKCPDRWKALLNLMYETGARISEILPLQIDQLNLKKQTVRIFEPKTMNYRITTLSSKTVRFLELYLSKYRRQPRKGYKNFLFINQQRRPMSSRAIQYLIKRLSKKYLGERHVITPHYFRAACAVHLLEAGVDIRQVQEIIGWKSLNIVQNYTRVTPQKQAELKAKYHPGFQSEENAKTHDKTSAQNSSSIVEQLERIRLQMEHMQTTYEQKLQDLQLNLQKEQQKREEEQKQHKNQVDELINRILQLSA